MCYGRSYGEIDYDVAVLNVNSTQVQHRHMGQIVTKKTPVLA